MIPRFVDIDPVTHTLDPNKLEEAITERVKALIVTHAWGLPADMDPIIEIAHRHGILVIEDCAHAILATYKGRFAGSLGDIGSFSFQASKQMSLGDGGMATTNDEELSKKLDLHAGAPTFHSIGHGLHYNYRMNELTAAVGVAQLERLPQVIGGLKGNAKYYDEAVSGCKWLRPQRAGYADSSYHFWAATFEGERFGIGLEDFRAAAKKGGLSASIGYTQMPAYEHPVIKRGLAHVFHCKGVTQDIEYPAGLCPVAERVIPRSVIIYTLKPQEDAKSDADKLRQIILDMEKGVAS
jgi:dTDP-4-amino-4,6-dideoxygalactose transaminase